MQPYWRFYQLIFEGQNTLPVITWYAIFTIRPKCQQRAAIFAECEVSLSRFLLRHRLYYWSDRPVLCGNLIEFDGKKCIYSRSFRFYKHFDVSEKNMGCLAHQKYVCCIFIIYSQCRQDSEVQNRMIFRDKEASFVNSVTETPGAFNRYSLLWHPYTLTFDVIPYTLKTIESYFPV